MAVLRTPEERFSELPGFPFTPRYVDVADPVEDHLRVHYVDEGPRGAPPVLLVHGQPTWSYVYRQVIPTLTERGLRAVAPDLVGFGRSDKPTERTAYSFASHVGWLSSFVTTTDLWDITLVAHDWGGPIGLSTLAAMPERFARVVATNTVLHTGDPDLAGMLDWANHDAGNGRVVLQQDLVNYVLLSQRAPNLDASLFVRFATTSAIPEDVLAAYDAPFPDERHKAGMRQFPVLIPLTPDDPGAAIGRETFEALRRWDRPFVTAFADSDPATRGWEAVFQRAVPGAAGQPHTTITAAGHFVQEDRGPELGRIIAESIQRRAVD